MNTQKIDEWLPEAYRILSDIGIATEDKKIDNAYRGQISTFGAAIMNGSLLAAVSFFSSDARSSSSVHRSLIPKAILWLVDPDYAKSHKEDKGALFGYVKDSRNKQTVKENILNATIALKLAMNLYTIMPDGKAK